MFWKMLSALLSDLIKYIPYFDTTYIKTANLQPVSQLVQLCYVLPKHSLHLLPSNVYKHLLETHPEWYGENHDIIWAFCRYFWESHAQLPEIDIHELEQFLRNIAWVAQDTIPFYTFFPLRICYRILLKCHLHRSHIHGLILHFLAVLEWNDIFPHFVPLLCKYHG